MPRRVYTLKTDPLPEDANPEMVAYLLERAADQVRDAETWDDARSMSGSASGVKFTHGAKGR